MHRGDEIPDRLSPELVGPDYAPRNDRFTRRAFLAATAAGSAAVALGVRIGAAIAGHMPSRPTAKRPPPSNDLVTYEETRLAFRRHGFPLEALDYPITPLGMHFVLLHFDVPRLDAVKPYTITVEGHVRRPLTVTLD